MNDFAWGLVTIVLTIACAALFPLGLIVLAPVLLFGGLSVRRRSRAAKTSAIANGAIAGGIAGILLIVVMFATIGFEYSTHTGGGSGTSGGTYPATPQAIQRILAP
ncbi:MAG TPA: hypothetical protein VHA53_04270 [Nitrolancea sp.]|nr:hypothetical protein [Nitrolancea sp.]